MTAEDKQEHELGKVIDQRDRGVIIPRDLAEIIVSLGEVQWGATASLSADEHADHVRESVKATAEHFEQSGPQPMNGLYLVGTETVLCHTGTSPNSGEIARALTGAWNRLLAEASHALYATPPTGHVEPSREAELEARVKYLEAAIRQLGGNINSYIYELLG